MDSLSEVYIQKLFQKIAFVFLIIGAINWGFQGVFKMNIIERFLGRGTFWVRCIYIAVGFAGFLLAFNRDTYLPFLGETVFPASILQVQTPPGATRSVEVKVTPNSKVVYWASEPSDGTGIHSYDRAYQKYMNAGVTTADSNGYAVLKVREPQAYTVPLKGKIDAHVHFRVCGPTGFIGRIKTVYVSSGRVEGFTV